MWGLSRKIRALDNISSNVVKMVVALITLGWVFVKSSTCKFIMPDVDESLFFAEINFFRVTVMQGRCML